MQCARGNLLPLNTSSIPTQQVHSKLCRRMFATEGGLPLPVLTASMRTAVKRLLSPASVAAQQAIPLLCSCMLLGLQSTLPALCRCLSVPALAVMGQPLAAAMGPSSTTLTSLP